MIGSAKVLSRGGSFAADLPRGIVWEIPEYTLPLVLQASLAYLIPVFLSNDTTRLPIPAAPTARMRRAKVSLVSLLGDDPSLPKQAGRMPDLQQHETKNGTLIYIRTCRSFPVRVPDPGPDSDGMWRRQMGSEGSGRRRPSVGHD